jgi:hypothetical protein
MQDNVLATAPMSAVLLPLKHCLEFARGTYCISWRPAKPGYLEAMCVTRKIVPLASSLT